MNCPHCGVDAAQHVPIAGRPDPVCPRQPDGSRIAVAGGHAYVIRPDGSYGQSVPLQPQPSPTAALLAEPSPDQVAAFRRACIGTRLGSEVASVEQWAADLLKAYNMRPIADMTPGQSVVYRIGTWGPQEFAAVERATGGKLTAAGLQETAQHVREIHAADEQLQDQAAAFLAERGIAASPEAVSPLHQIAALDVAASQAGKDPLVYAYEAGLTTVPPPVPGQAEAEAERAGRSTDPAVAHLQANSNLQAMLESPAFQDVSEWAFAQRADALRALGIEKKPGESAGRAMIRGLLPLTDPGLINVHREFGDVKIEPHEFYERVAGILGDLTGDPQSTQEVLETLGRSLTADQLIGRMQERDGGPPPAEEPDNKGERWHAIAAEMAKVEAKAPPTKKIDRSYAETDWRYDLDAAWRKVHGESLEGLDAAPKVKAEVFRRPAENIREAVHAGDSWRDHLSTEWDRQESGNPEAYDSLRDSALAEADELEEDARKAETEAA